MDGKLKYIKDGSKCATCLTSVGTLDKRGAHEYQS